MDVVPTIPSALAARCDIRAAAAARWLAGELDRHEAGAPPAIRRPE